MNSGQAALTVKVNCDGLPASVLARGSTRLQREGLLSSRVPQVPSLSLYAASSPTPLRTLLQKAETVFCDFFEQEHRSY